MNNRLENFGLSFLNVYKQADRSAALFVQPYSQDFKFTKGEFVSDYLGFFGFGSGFFTDKGDGMRDGPARLLGDGTLFLDPFDFNSLRANMIKLVSLLTQYMLTPADLQRFLSLCSALTRINIHTKVSSSKMLTELCCDDVPPAAIGYIVNSDGKKFVFISRDDISVPTPTFDYSLCTQIGDLTHLRATLDALARITFMKDLDYQKLAINTLKNTLSGFTSVHDSRVEF